ncbi:MAG: sigma-54-dependent Fis family transcriptional regulator [Magnetococcales bacterium]|nr:sigma-54-dependent Fis family transcriptional regulator [Magnetococcales bacterium]
MTCKSSNNTMIGQAPAFKSVINAVSMVAPSDVSVLINGESGTGKELLAQLIHQKSTRRNRPMIALNCGALPENLVESELFGHRRGAFTGAVQDSPGLIRSAQGGTLFLDEIGELPLSIQPRLLRFLETGEIQPVGHTHTQKVDARIIAATNRDLRVEMKAGRFREDLFYRLNVVPLTLPPLRERHGDIALLMDTLSNQFAQRHSVKAPRFTKPVLEALKRYSWPGNIRELRNYCERMTILAPGSEVSLAHLPAEFHQHTLSSHNQDSAVILPDHGIDLASWEQNLICQALEKSRGNKSKAARLLGLTRDTLLYRIKKYAL